MFFVRALGRAEIHGNAVLHHFVLFQDLIEDVQGPPAIDHEIFGNDLKPVHHRFARENVMVMRRAQTNPDSIISKIVKPICRHLGSEDAEEVSRAGTAKSGPRQDNFCFAANAPRSVIPASLNRLLRNHPCPCKSSCPYSHCRSIYIHPCPCKNSDPCKRAFLSPSCRLAPDRPARQLSSQVEDSMLESLRWYQQANLRVPHQLLEPSWTLSFPELPPVEFGLQPLLLLLRHPDVFGCLFGLVL